MASEWAMKRVADTLFGESTGDVLRNRVAVDRMAEILDAELSPLGPLRRALQADSDYAWSWHCNLAMAFYDELSRTEGMLPGGGELDLPDTKYAICNRAAARFMKQAFDVETKEPAEAEFEAGAAT